MPMKCSADSLKYFTFVSHICSFTSMIPLAFHVWQSYLLFANAYEFFTAIHKPFTFGRHICSLYTACHIIGIYPKK